MEAYFIFCYFKEKAIKMQEEQRKMYKENMERERQREEREKLRYTARLGGSILWN